MFFRLWTRAPRIDKKSSTTIKGIASPEKAFRQRLLDWYTLVCRPLPWRATSDPYAIWISEIMLQQTRVASVLPYYKLWMERFPSVESLAAAIDEEVLLCWSGLGYYSRARNLLKAAKQIGSRFPSDYDGIRELAGVGDYTAAAISSIAFGLPHAAVDGNVLRVMARIGNDSGDIGSGATRQRLIKAANHLLDRTRPGTFNQAMMELGATVCLPRKPQCLACPVSNLCEARKRGTQNDLPVKLRHVDPIHIQRTLLILQRRGRLLFWQRPADASKLAGFWELPELEHVPGAALGRTIGDFRHTVTNHNYLFTVCEAFVKSTPDGLRWLRPRPLEYLYSTAARKALKIAGFAGF
jgi:A/G-specific adenine glycosylase